MHRLYLLTTSCGSVNGKRAHLPEGKIRHPTQPAHLRLPRALGFDALRKNPSPPIGIGTRNAFSHNYKTVTHTPSIQPESGAASNPVPLRRLGILRRLKTSAGILLIEAIIAAGALALVIVGASQALLIANRMAATSRVLTAARSVVQRNIDTALTTTFTQASTPAILAYPANAVVWDDDGGADNIVQIQLQDNNTAVVASGVLTRTVTALANADNAVVLQVTFSLTYTYRGRTDTVSMTTIRARDD